MGGQISNISVHLKSGHQMGGFLREWLIRGGLPFIK